jgi:hypothetical protein
LKASQRQEGAVFRTVFKPEQHVPAGLLMVLSFVTNDKQSTKEETRDVQSTEGDGALCDDEAPFVKLIAQMAKMQRMSENFDAMMMKKCRE